MSISSEPTPEHADPSITFTVDGEPVSTRERKLTPVQIMELGDVDPMTNYLVRVDGRHQTSYRDDPDQKIEVHEGEVFVTVPTGPTPVS